MRTVFAIRPEPGCAATVALGEAMDLTIAGHPLFAVEPLAWQAEAAEDFDAVLLGSANAIRHGGTGLNALTGLPALCVGATTADAACNAGFAVVATGSGGLQELLPVAAEHGFTKILRLSGEAHVALSAPDGMTIDSVVCYRVVALPIDWSFADILRRGALVLLHSGEAAAHFVQETDRLAMPRDAIALACLAPRVAARAGDGWAAVEIAAEPADAALLVLARQMCQA